MDQNIHWADMTATKIIREKGDKEQYVLASGITPSGVVHFGNFREVITVDFVARALRAKGKKVRFIFSWDDYDTFRKVPKNMPKQDELEKFLYQPIVDTPDPYGVDESYARHHEKNFETQLRKMGVEVEPIYQAKKYRSGIYAPSIKKALLEKDKIGEILNRHRQEDLGDQWMPLLVYCEKCNRDRIGSVTFDGVDTIGYTCELCHHKGSEPLSKTSRAKLPWRVDWPMRWAFEQVDFEPGGKDHSSEGGSYTTAQDIVKEIFGGTPPVYLQYDFVSVKGQGGKMSSSAGNLVTVNDVLDVFEPEMVRWIFASYKPNVDFSISFDLDVIKTYEDFDRQERLAFGIEEGNEKKVAMAKRVIELAQIGPMPKEMPFQPSFRHLTNILQINGGDLSKAKSYYKDEIKNARDERRFNERSTCALFWLNNYAPEDFKFSLNKTAPAMTLSVEEKKLLQGLVNHLETKWPATDKELHEALYGLIHEATLEPQAAFTMIYQMLISKERGPKLAGFIMTVGKEDVVKIFKSAL